jgi:acyl-CoA thioesterase I
MTFSLIIMRYLLLLLFVAGCAFTPVAPQAPTNQMPSGKIIALGDSLTAGAGVATNETYPARLQQMLQQNGYNYTVQNAGVNGDTTIGVLNRLDKVIAERPDIVILEIGVNDALRGKQAVVIEGNLSLIVERLQSEGIEVIMVTPGDLQAFGLGHFSGAYAAVAQKYNLTTVSSFLGGVIGLRDLNLGDRVHPNAAGYELVARNVYPAVVQKIS